MYNSFRQIVNNVSLNRLTKLGQMNRISCYGNSRYCGNIVKLSPASCIGSIIQGTAKTISMSISPGNPPYVLHFLVDGIEKTIVPVWSGDNATFSYTFNESLGDHTYGSYAVDNCGTGNLISNTDECTISIVSETPTIPGNLVLNSDFQMSTTPGTPDYWYVYQTGTTSIFKYPDIGMPGGSTKSISIQCPTLEPENFAQVGQNIGNIKPSGYYELAGYMMTENIVGVVGASIQTNWLDATGNFLSTSLINSVLGTTSWTQYTGIVQAPYNAVQGFVILQIYQSSGKAYYTDISFLETTAPICATTPVVIMTIK